MKDKYSILPDDFKFRMQQEKLKNEIFAQKRINDKYDKMISQSKPTFKLDGTLDFSYQKWIEDIRKQELKIK